MVRRLIIHAGMPRAGSSTLQEALFRQRRKLEPAGLLYPALDLKHSTDGKAGQVYNHRQLCESGKGLWRSRRFHELHAEIVGTILGSSAQHIVLSYEGWWDLRNHQSLKRTLEALRARIPDLAVTIGAVVRDPPHFLLSLYKLDVLHGRTRESFETYWPTKLREPRLRYADAADAFEKLAEETCYVRFEDAVKGGRLVGNVLDSFGLEGFFQRAGTAHLERHRSPGGVFFGDAVITMMRFAATEMGLAKLSANRVTLMHLMQQLSQRPDLRDDCQSLVIPLSRRAAEAVAAATRAQAQVFYRRFLSEEAPIPSDCEDDRTQSSIDPGSALGRAIRTELSKF